MRLSQINIPNKYNYIECYLTYRCQLRCPYCINGYGELKPVVELSGKDWVKGINRIKTRVDLPVTIGGGEPTLHPEFYEIVNGISSRIKLDLLSNGMFDVEEFMDRVSPKRFSRKAPYASIRLSYHPMTTKGEVLVHNAGRLNTEGYSVGVWGLLVPGYEKSVYELQNKCLGLGIDFRTKEYLDKDYGTYKYPEAVTGKAKPAICRGSELLVAPDGNIYKCHHHLYGRVEPRGNIAEYNQVYLSTEHEYCMDYGLCNPCDVKVKFDRFQVQGHCAVDIVALKK
jgi:MoaA/NifB/PqqE/SkfB family radical SAM enzyme